MSAGAKRPFVRKQDKNRLKKHLLDTDTLQLLGALSEEDVRQTTSKAKDILNGLRVFGVETDTLDHLCNWALGTFAVNPDNSEDITHAKAVFQRLHDIIHDRSGQASHREKRHMVRELQLKPISQSIDDLVEMGEVEIVYRRREQLRPFRMRYTMTEVRTRGEKTVFIDPEEFYVVEEGRSVIFYSDGIPPDKYRVELVVIRQVAYRSTQLSPHLYAYLQHVVEEAVSERRDVRPSHPGKMVQTGFNTGPRHAKAFGFAVSYTKKLSDTTKELHDKDIVAAGSLIWHLVLAHMPREVIDETQKHLADKGLPNLATQRVAEGDGFSFEMDGKVYEFPYVQRAPPEFYLARGYTAPIHQDPAYSRWSFTLTTKREPGPTSIGGNFVDVTLRVIVRQAKATLLAHDAGEPHGTTIGPADSTNQIMAIVFTQKLAQCWQQLQESQCVVKSGEGANNETHDTQA